MRNISALYYDGQSARQEAVTLSIHNGKILLQGDQLEREFDLDKITISAKLGSTPRLIHLLDGGHCEVDDHLGFDAMLDESGVSPPTLISRLENSWHYALAATLLTISFVLAMFYWGLPYIANMAAERVPDTLSLTIDEQVLDTLDDGLAEETQLSAKRQAGLSARFERLRKKNERPLAHLEFRDSDEIGANAFALPGGTIIITDQLVELAHNDEEILAVLAHELGHVKERHPLRQLLQSSVIGLSMTWYFGDISSLLAIAPTVMLETSYSRNFERRADLYAVTLLRRNGIKPGRLADILERLENDHTGHQSKHEAYSPIFDLFSTHPNTDERIRILRHANTTK